jgi:Peptidase propeptide and YPEB domain
MRKTVKIGAGLTSAAIVASMAAGVASAAASGQRPATASASVSTTAHVTRAQARHLARAAVPHSRVIEVESDDLHDRAVWKVKLATPHGRVVADVDKRTGKVTIIRGHRHGGGGHDHAALAPAAAGPGALPRLDDHGRDRGDDHGGRGPGHDGGHDHDGGQGGGQDHNRGHDGDG